MKNNQNLVSVIIPTYNRKNLIKKAIYSVLNQTYQNIEILILDDGSTDKTKEVIKSIHSNKIKYFFQEHSGNPAKVRNFGINISKGRYIAFLDSDDLWLKKKIEKQIKIFKKNKHILAIASNGIKYRSKIPHKIKKTEKNKIISYKDLIKQNLIITSSMIIKKHVIKEIGLFDEDIMLRSSEDYDYWLRILQYRNNSIFILSEPLIIYRIHGNNIGIFNENELFNLKRFNRIDLIYKKHSKNFHKNGFLNEILKQKNYEKKLIKLRKKLFYNEISVVRVLKIRNIYFIDKIEIILMVFSLKLIKTIDFKKLNSLFKDFKILFNNIFKN